MPLYTPAVNLTGDQTAAGIKTFTSAVALSGGATIAAGQSLIWAGDTNLYRSAADTLKTDDALIVGGTTTLSAAVTQTGGYSTFDGLRLRGTDTSNTIYQSTGALAIAAADANIVFKRFGGNPSNAVALELGVVAGVSQTIGFLGATPVARPGSTADIKASLVALGLITGGGATPLDLGGGVLTAGSLAVAGNVTIANPAGNSNVIINAAATFDSFLYWQIGGVYKWSDKVLSDGKRYIADQVNGRNQIALTPGVSAAAALTTLDCRLIVNEACTVGGTLTAVGNALMQSTLTVGRSTVQGGIAAHVVAPDANTYPLVVQGIAGQATDLVRIWNSVAAQVIVTSAGVLQLNNGMTFGTDTNLYRSAADTLKTDDTLVVGTGQSFWAPAMNIDHATPKLSFNVTGVAERAYIQYSTATPALRIDSDESIQLAPANITALTLDSAGKLLFGTALDTNLYRYAADSLATDDALYLLRNATGYSQNINNPHATGTGINVTLGAATSAVLKAQITGDAGYRFLADANGTLWWGPGTAGYDSYLYRSGVNALRTDSSFTAASLTATGTATVSGALYANSHAAVAGNLAIAGNVGFYGTASVAKPTVTGSRGGNAALASLLTALASQGLLTDSSTA